MCWQRVRYSSEAAGSATVLFASRCALANILEAGAHGGDDGITSDGCCHRHRGRRSVHLVLTVTFDGEDGR